MEIALRRETAAAIHVRPAEALEAAGQKTKDQQVEDQQAEDQRIAASGQFEAAR